MLAGHMNWPSWSVPCSCWTLFYTRQLCCWIIFTVTTFVWKTWKCRGIYSCQGNVRDFTKSQGSVRKKSCQGKVTLNCLLLAAYLRPFLTLLSLCISFWFRIMHCCIPTLTTDNNTSTGMIWVTLNMPCAANCQGISHCLESGHPVIGENTGLQWGGVKLLAFWRLAGM